MSCTLTLPSPCKGEGSGAGQVRKALFVAAGLRDNNICRSILRLAAELRRRGVEVAVACGGGPLLPDFQRAGIPAFVAPKLATTRRPLLVPRALRDHVASFGPDLLHFFGRPLARWAVRLAGLTAKPYVLTVASFPSPGHRVKVPGDWRRGAIMAASEELREELVNRSRIPKDSIAVIPIGIALEEYERYEATHDRTAVPVVGTVGPLTEERGCEFFVRAAHQVIERGYSAQFLIAGDGPEGRALRRLIHELRIDRWVTLTEAFTDYRRMIAVLDICVVPAVREGLGLDVLEAMACRKPVVATGAGPAYTLISDGETGLLAPKKDPGAIAEKVIRLLREPELARRIVDAAYWMVRRRFSVEATTEQLLAFYARHIGRSEAT